MLNRFGDTAEQIANLALFSNVQPAGYWSGTEYAPNPVLAWGFLTNSGIQVRASQTDTAVAVAVRPGDVAASVPEPQTLALALLALALLALALLALGATVVADRRRPVGGFGASGALLCRQG